MSAPSPSLTPDLRLRTLDDGGLNHTATGSARRSMHDNIIYNLKIFIFFWQNFRFMDYWETYGDNDTYWNLVNEMRKIAKDHGNAYFKPIFIKNIFLQFLANLNDRYYSVALLEIYQCLSRLSLKFNLQTYNIIYIWLFCQVNRVTDEAPIAKNPCYESSVY